ncbi:hypothetical protein PILCRDRAFT_627798 [Piloderma croceum F 1598]|uniref:Uncharacterized protein n=1 Tax=Piloderma croceum (strain F 1598) TaxID=765440 RepID=A0A0C3FBB4_PILCF|nr:hypothetical protein PILCRDRAFT_627798 [Piloderma croceum F 1598]
MPITTPRRTVLFANASANARRRFGDWRRLSALYRSMAAGMKGRDDHSGLPLHNFPVTSYQLVIVRILQYRQRLWLCRFVEWNFIRPSRHGPIDTVHSHRPHHLGHCPLTFWKP